MSDKKKETSYQVIVAIIGASAVCLTAIIGLWQPLVTRLVDIFLPVATPSLSSMTPTPTLTNPAPSIGTNLTLTPVWSPNPILQEKESFPVSPVTYRHLSVGWRFAIRDDIRDYAFSSMEINENAPYIVFLIKGPYSLVVGGPTEVDIQISDGEWRHWVNAYDDN